MTHKATAGGLQEAPSAQRRIFKVTRTPRHGVGAGGESGLAGAAVIRKAQLPLGLFTEISPQN